MELTVPNRLSTLGHPARLSVFRLLMRRYPDRVPATELANALSIKPNTLSSYLGALMQAGLVTQERAGTSLRYAIDMQTVRETFDYLLRDCCRGRPDVCAQISDRAAQAVFLADPPPNSPASSVFQGAHSMADRKFNVLFICTGNSARSIFAESILHKEAGDRFVAFSAGTRPRSQMNPFALEVLESKGHDISRLRSKNVSEFQGPDAPGFDFVFTVCDRAANEECPAWAGQPVSAHWGMPDPVKVEGADAEKSLAFQQAFGALSNRIRAFAALPLASLDRISLQKAVDDIGRSGVEGGAHSGAGASA
ncbi:MAG: helix-turn-helix domain-containing protein [Pseudomonadota bacterium]